MPDEVLDQIRAIDKRAADAVQRYIRDHTLAIGRVKSTTLSGASVQLSESGRYERNVQSLRGVDIVPGSMVMMARIGRMGWVIVGAVEDSHSSTATTESIVPVSAVQSLTVTPKAWYLDIRWTASYFDIRAYEVMINTSESETGATTYVTDNTQYLYYDDPATYYVRVRAVGPDWDRGSWTAWYSATITTTYIGALNALDYWLRLPGGTAFPGDPSEADIFYRTDEDTVYVHDGASWVELGGGDSFVGGTLTSDLILDDGSGNSPSLKFVAETNDDTLEMVLEDDPGGVADFKIKLPPGTTAVNLTIEDSNGVDLLMIRGDGVVYIPGTFEIDGLASFYGQAEFGADITIGNGDNIILATSTGTKLGTAANQKLGFHGAAPVVQRAHIIDADGTLLDITTKFNTLLAALEALGLLAAS